MQIQQDRSRQAECGDCPEQSCAHPFCCRPAMPIAEKILPCRHRATDPKRPKNSTISVVARGRAILGGVCSDRYRLAPLRQWLARYWRSAGGHARRPAFSRSEGPAPWSSILTGADLLNRYFTAERGADALDGLQPDRSWPCRQHRSPRQCLKCATRPARSRLGQPDLHLACHSARTGAHPHRSGTGWRAASPGMTATVPIGGTSQPSWYG